MNPMRYWVADFEAAAFDLSKWIKAREFMIGAEI